MKIGPGGHCGSKMQYIGILHPIYYAFKLILKNIFSQVDHTVQKNDGSNKENDNANNQHPHHQSSPPPILLVDHISPGISDWQLGAEVQVENKIGNVD